VEGARMGLLEVQALGQGKFRASAMYVLEKIPVTKAEVDNIEYKIRKMWLHAQGIISSATRVVLALPRGWGGLGWDIWYNVRCCGSVTSFFLLTAADGDERAAMAAQVDRLQFVMGTHMPVMEGECHWKHPGRLKLQAGWWGTVAPWVTQHGFTITGGQHRCGRRVGDVGLMTLAGTLEERRQVLRSKCWWLSEALEADGYTVGTTIGQRCPLVYGIIHRLWERQAGIAGIYHGHPGGEEEEEIGEEEKRRAEEERGEVARGGRPHLWAGATLTIDRRRQVGLGPFYTHSDVGQGKGGGFVIFVADRIIGLGEMVARVDRDGDGTWFTVRKCTAHRYQQKPQVWRGPGEGDRWSGWFRKRDKKDGDAEVEVREGWWFPVEVMRSATDSRSLHLRRHYPSFVRHTLAEWTKRGARVPTPHRGPWAVPCPPPLPLHAMTQMRWWKQRQQLGGWLANKPVNGDRFTYKDSAIYLQQHCEAAGLEVMERGVEVAEAEASMVGEARRNQTQTPKGQRRPAAAQQPVFGPRVCNHWNTYSDGARKVIWTGTERKAIGGYSWVLVHSEQEGEARRRYAVGGGGQAVTGSTDSNNSYRLEAYGLLAAMIGMRWWVRALPAEDHRVIHHLDNEAVVHTYQRLLKLDAEAWINLEDRDVWRAILAERAWWGDDYEVHWVASHVEKRKKDRNDWTEHEWGNVYSDKWAGRCVARAGERGSKGCRAEDFGQETLGVPDWTRVRQWLRQDQQEVWGPIMEIQEKVWRWRLLHQGEEVRGKMRKSIMQIVRLQEAAPYLQPTKPNRSDPDSDVPYHVAPVDWSALRGALSAAPGLHSRGYILMLKIWWGWLATGKKMMQRLGDRGTAAEREAIGCCPACGQPGEDKWHLIADCLAPNMVEMRRIWCTKLQARMGGWQVGGDVQQAFKVVWQLTDEGRLRQFRAEDTYMLVGGDGDLGESAALVALFRSLESERGWTEGRLTELWEPAMRAGGMGEREAAGALRGLMGMFQPWFSAMWEARNQHLRQDDPRQDTGDRRAAQRALVQATEAFKRLPRARRRVVERFPYSKLVRWYAQNAATGHRVVACARAAQQRQLRLKQRRSFGDGTIPVWAGKGEGRTAAKRAPPDASIMPLPRGEGYRKKFRRRQEEGGRGGRGAGDIMGGKRKGRKTARGRVPGPAKRMCLRRDTAGALRLQTHDATTTFPVTGQKRARTTTREATGTRKRQQTLTTAWGGRAAETTASIERETRLGVD
jgi:hypothetical protein